MKGAVCVNVNCYIYSLQISKGFILKSFVLYEEKKNRKVKKGKNVRKCEEKKNYDRR